MDRRPVVAGAVLALALAIGLAWWMRPVDTGLDDLPEVGCSVSTEDGGSRRSRERESTPGDDSREGGDDAAASDEAEDALATADEEVDLDELAEQLENDPNTQVVCDLSLPIEQSVGYLAIGEHSGFNGRRVQIVKGKAYMPLVYDLGDHGDAVFEERSGVFTVEGYGPARISWTDPPEDGGKGSCTATIEPEPGMASLTGTLTLQPSGNPASGGWVEGCGNMAFADDMGVVHMDIVAEPCTLIAMRQDGMLRTISEPMDVEPRKGEDVVLDITIPEKKRGGLGIQISEHDAGISIDGLIDGGPAGAAGLLPGDIIVTVEGEAAADLPIGEFVQLLGGESGTDVAIVVDRDGEQLEFVLTREVLEAPQPG